MMSASETAIASILKQTTISDKASSRDSSATRHGYSDEEEEKPHARSAEFNRSRARTREDGRNWNNRSRERSGSFTRKGQLSGRVQTSRRDDRELTCWNCGTKGQTEEQEGEELETEAHHDRDTCLDAQFREDELRI